VTKPNIPFFHIYQIWGSTYIQTIPPSHPNPVRFGARVHSLSPEPRCRATTCVRLSRKERGQRDHRAACGEEKNECASWASKPPRAMRAMEQYGSLIQSWSKYWWPRSIEADAASCRRWRVVGPRVIWEQYGSLIQSARHVSLLECNKSTIYFSNHASDVAFHRAFSLIRKDLSGLT
jgi:hypothetical protein